MSSQIQIGGMSYIVFKKIIDVILCSLPIGYNKSLKINTNFDNQYLFFSVQIL